MVTKGLKRNFFIKIKIFGHFHTSVEMLMAIITLFHVHLSFEKKGLDSEVQWPKMDIFGSRGLKNFISQFGQRVVLPACKAGFARAVQGFHILVVKHSQK